MKKQILFRRFPVIPRLFLRVTGMFALLFLILSFVPAEEDCFHDRVSRWFGMQSELTQEKVYFHTDKPVYSAGETIFLKAYLVDAMTHSPRVPTNFVYVELLDRSDSVLVRKKIKRTGNRFVGSVDIPLLFPSGDYYLRGYTEWMRNASPDYFFYKRLQIGNAIVTDINPRVSYVEAEDGGRVMKIGFFDDREKPYAGEKLRYTLTDKTGRIYRSRGLRTNDEGIIYVRLDERSPASADPRVDIVFESDKYEYGRSFYIGSKSQNYALSFFPEGGNLLAGVPQVVAFKGQNERGFGEEVTGFILDTRNDTVAVIKSERDGMGRFLLTARPGESFRAEVRSAEGVVKTFSLPPVCDEGFALAMTGGQGKVFYKVLRAGNLPLSDTLHLLGHTRGRVVFTADVFPGKSSGVIDASLFPDGIAHFVLCDTSGVPRSERLFFFLKPRAARCAVRVEGKSYGRREPVDFTLLLKNAEGKPLQGDFSVGIVDARSVRSDTLAANIVSSLLLTSDLKGYVADPSYYFGADASVPYFRDLLMLTHGWSRFRVEDLRRFPRTDVNYFKEAGQFVSGHVENLFGGRAKNPIVIGAWWDGCDSTLHFVRTTGDDKGNYVLENIEFRDTARFLIQGRTKRRIGAVGVTVDSMTYPEAGRPVYFRDDYKLLTGDYLGQVRADYFNKGGMPVYSLKEIFVYGDKMADYKQGLDSEIFSPSEFKKDNLHSLFDALCCLPGVSYHWGRSGISYRGRGIGTIVIDNCVVPSDIVNPIDYIKNVDLSCIASIELIFDAQTARLSGVMGGPVNKTGCVVFVRLNDIGFKQLLAVSPGLTLFRLQGYSAAKEFYQPEYDLPWVRDNKTPDLRTTLYWNPAPSVDSTGTMHLRFYTSDYPENYRIEVEGITHNGDPLYFAAPLTLVRKR